MFKLVIVLSALLAVACASPAATPTAAAAAATASQIRTDQDPVYHFNISRFSEGQPQLGPESTSGYFNIGSTVSLNTSTPLFFNVNMTASTSYKPVSFGASATSAEWSMSGDTLVFDGQQNFLVCPISGSANYELFLQTGDDTPAGEDCTDWITIHLDCLC